MQILRASIDPKFAKGLALSGAIAAVAMWAANLPVMQRWGLSALTLSILIGIAVGNTVFPYISSSCSSGVDFSKNRLLRLGIVLYGFRITFQQIAEIGWAGVLIDAIIVLCTFTLAVQLGTRLFGLDRQTAMLIGAGSSICGAAAVMAAAPVVQGPAHKISVAVATVVVFGTLSMFLYPIAYPFLDMSEVHYGVYVGSTVHEVAQVVAAGRAVSEQAAGIAVIEKMLRVMMLAPFLLILSSHLSGERNAMGQSKASSIPWFAVFFIVVAGVHSLQLLPDALVRNLVLLDNILLAMAMGALGLRTHASAIKQAGLKPILLAALLFVFLTIGGYLINRVLGVFV